MLPPSAFPDKMNPARERHVLRVALALNLAGLLVFWLDVPYLDFVIGTLIGLYVIKESIEILRDARSESDE